MSDPQQSLLLTLLLLLFIIQPILLGAFVRKVHRRSGLLWGLLAFSMDVGTLVLFERHMAAQVFADAAAEVGTAIILSTIVIVAILVSLDGGPQTRAGAEPSINFRRGLFRIWVLISGSWIIFCATTFVNKCFSRYVVRSTSISEQGSSEYHCSPLWPVWPCVGWSRALGDRRPGVPVRALRETMMPPQPKFAEPTDRTCQTRGARPPNVTCHRDRERWRRPHPIYVSHTMPARRPRTRG